MNYQLLLFVVFGAQSVGKSTFLNELTGSLFDVSGMRCTEGIWMSIKLFLNEIKAENNNCNFNCSNCKIKNCSLLRYNIDDDNERNKCLCETCICGEDCCLYDINSKFLNCNLKCCLQKGHENLIKCNFKECKCRCICNCICDKNNKLEHKHLCKICLEKNLAECYDCMCYCKHLCKYPILLHNFICICLDFEGLATIERTNEQDIQMALVGSGLGNNIIFRTHNSFDKFTESTLEKIGLGSRKLKEIKLDDFFGGSLFFCPRDVLDDDQEDLCKEFDVKIKNSVTKWMNQLNKDNKYEKQLDNENSNYIYFGIFDSHFFAPTPPYIKRNFYKTLRKELIPDILENSLKFNRHPIYKTGKEFYENLKKLEFI